MLLSESWLREWVDTELTVDEIADKLTLAGLEVEGIVPASDFGAKKANQRKIVVGRIDRVDPHPNADKLRVCQVNIGRRQLLEIVCGAPNARVGLLIPVAMVGAHLPGLEIKTSSIRGVESSGMLCSSAELGLSESASGLMELDSEAPVGVSLWDYLGLDDKVIEIDLTPNRGDCLCVQGIAREISALTGCRMRDTAIKKVAAKCKTSLPVKLEATDGCARFAGRAILNINMAARTPDWMQQKLLRSGVRSINPVVDITNYVMLETGQPMHGYDLDKLNGGIIVRRAKKREKLKLLDGSTVTMNEQNLVIADDHRAVGLAGIMGGDLTAISDQTVNIFFEAAFFAPGDIIGKARQFGMHTDASHRFERGVDPTGQIVAIERATALLLDIAGGVPGKVCHALDRKALPKNKTITLDNKELPRMLGITIPANSTKSILRKLGMDVSGTANAFKVKPPAWRFDISGQHDLVEEVGRCYGYEKIVPRMPSSAARTGGYLERDVSQYALKQLLTSRGYYEAINYSFIDPELQKSVLGLSAGIKLQNPLADNMSEMRQSLIPGLLNNLARNQNRQEDRIRLFESGTVFSGKGKKRIEIRKIAAVMSGTVLPRQWATSSREVDFYDLKGDLEALIDLGASGKAIDFQRCEQNGLHPGQAADVLIEGKRAGYIGRLHPVVQQQLDIDRDVYVFEIDQDILTKATLPAFAPLSRFPSVERDLAVVVNHDVSVEQVLKTVKNNAGNDLKRLELFDMYQGERVEKNKKSFAFSLTFQSESSSLRAGDIDEITAKIITALEEKVGAQLRA
ncbi:MAG: phenylalanine--tRNA ligase subunit beta [Acidiferrobacterales bacterium]|nr:phenylalanine--tRNA ligase subunit beta [Acidiferrobacterales bacterium]